MSDLIKRQDVFDVLKKVGLCAIPSYLFEKIWVRIKELPTAEPEQRWIPFTMREVTAEEKEVYPEWDSILDCKLPDDGEEILVSNGKYVWLDTFINDCDGCYLDGGDDVEGLAWQPLPKPWNGVSDE